MFVASISVLYNLSVLDRLFNEFAIVSIHSSSIDHSGAIEYIVDNILEASLAQSLA